MRSQPRGECVCTLDLGRGIGRTVLDPDDLIANLDDQLGIALGAEAPDRWGAGGGDGVEVPSGSALQDEVDLLPQSALIRPFPHNKLLLRRRWAQLHASPRHLHAAGLSLRSEDERDEHLG